MIVAQSTDRASACPNEASQMTDRRSRQRYCRPLTRRRRRLGLIARSERRHRAYVARVASRERSTARRQSVRARHLHRLPQNSVSLCPCAPIVPTRERAALRPCRGRSDPGLLTSPAASVRCGHFSIGARPGTSSSPVEFPETPELTGLFAYDRAAGHVTTLQFDAFGNFEELQNLPHWRRTWTSFVPYGTDGLLAYERGSGYATLLNLDRAGLPREVRSSQ